MKALEKLKESSEKQNPFVIKSTRLKKEAEKDNGLFYFFINIFLDNENKTGKNFISYDDIDYVEYKLHESFPNRFRVSRAKDDQFEIKIWTYGFFHVSAKIFTKWGQIIEAKGKVDFEVNQVEKDNNKGELEW